jgi:glycosyltransferase involved in cell wall biosynthesis
MNSGLSVLMATYHGDRPSSLRSAISSVWNQQTLRPFEIVLVVDGDVGTESNSVIEEAKATIASALNVVRQPRNSGLSLALNTGLAFCRSELVARMDADDISAPTRFEKQVIFMRAHPEIAVLGSWATELDENTGATVLRRVPESHVEIERFAKTRNPISHPTVVFRRLPVLAVGGYPNIKIEDYALWTVLLQKGFKFANISEILVEMNGGRSLMLRRGLRFYRSEMQLLAFQRHSGFLSVPQFVFNLAGRFLTRAVPVSLRAFLYKIARR